MSTCETNFPFEESICQAEVTNILEYCDWGPRGKETEKVASFHLTFQNVTA